MVSKIRRLTWRNILLRRSVEDRKTSTKGVDRSGTHVDDESNSKSLEIVIIFSV